MSRIDQVGVGEFTGLNVWRADIKGESMNRGVVALDLSLRAQTLHQMLISEAGEMNILVRCAATCTLSPLERRGCSIARHVCERCLRR